MALSLKDQGNALFGAGKYDEALTVYAAAVEQSGASTDVQLACHKNSSQAYLKLKKYKEAVQSATKALDIAPNDVKALYRRGQAHVALKQWEEGFKDLRLAVSLDVTNKEVADFLKQSAAAYQKESDAKADAAKPTRQLGSLLDGATNFAQPGAAKAASEKLVALSSDKAFLAKLAEDGGIPQIINALPKVTTDNDVQEAMSNMLRTLTSMAAEPRLAEAIATALPQKGPLPLGNKAYSSALRSAIIALYSALAQHAGAVDDKVPVEQKATMKLYTTVPDAAHRVFTEAIKDADETVQSSAINALIKVVGNVPAAEAFIKSDAFKLVLDVGGQHLRKRASQMAPVALAKIFEVLGYQKKQAAKDAALKAFEGKFDEENAIKIQALYSLAMLFQADAEVAASVLLQHDLIDELVDGVEFDTEETMIAICEVFAQASNEKTCRLPIATKALDFLVLKMLATNPRLSIRAAVALSKASAANAEARKEIFEKTDTATHILKLLGDKTMPIDVRHWAVEGTAYLSVNPEMKERIVKEPGALDSLFELTKTDDKPLLYGITSVMANLSRFRKRLTEEEEQMQKIREFAKEAVNKAHPLDDDPVVMKRIAALVVRGGVAALVQLCKVKSDNIHEALSTILQSMAVEPKHRGLIVQQGGVAALLLLANEGTKDGMEAAAHALAKVAISMDPSIAFKGQRAAELVRPLLNLLKSEEGLKNFESLLALTNLTSYSEELRMRVMHEKGIPLIEDYMFSDHVLIRRAACETMCNMAMCDEVFEKYDKAESGEKVKLLLALSDSEDFETRRAAAGALAILSSSENVCKHIKAQEIGLNVLLSILKDGVEAQQATKISEINASASKEGDVEDLDEEEAAELGEEAGAQKEDETPLLKPEEGIELQHRALVILNNMSRDKELAKAIVESGLGQVIELLSFSSTPIIKSNATQIMSNLDKL